TDGKKVVEVRPDVEWDKGRATTFLIDTLLAGTGSAPVIYVGDDRTDEDAFRALRGRGDGVLVAPHPVPHSAATAWLRAPDEVVTVLERLADDARATDRPRCPAAWERAWPSRSACSAPSSRSGSCERGSSCPPWTYRQEQRVRPTPRWPQASCFSLRSFSAPSRSR